eukprot:scaffold61325_cov54-Phaeocystis_antarctica.AAC.2
MVAAGGRGLGVDLPEGEEALAGPPPTGAPLLTSRNCGSSASSASTAEAGSTSNLASTPDSIASTVCAVAGRFLRVSSSTATPNQGAWSWASMVCVHGARPPLAAGWRSVHLPSATT